MHPLAQGVFWTLKKPQNYCLEAYLFQPESLQVERNCRDLVAAAPTTATATAA